MRLNNNSIKSEAALWEAAGYDLPHFDREAVKKATADNPFWVHFGAGNIFRAFHTNIVQKLLNSGEINRGIIVAEGFDYEIVEKVNRKCDELTILATLKVSGKVEKSVIGSITESCILDSNNVSEFARLNPLHTAWLFMACLLGLCAIKSIIGNKKYAKTNKAFILERMFGDQGIDHDTYEAMDIFNVRNAVAYVNWNGGIDLLQTRC